jgi:hypothetical protein
VQACIKPQDTVGFIYLSSAKMLHNPQKKYSSNEIRDSPEEHAAPIGHTAREYHAYPGSKNALPADDLERQR